MYLVRISDCTLKNSRIPINTNLIVFNVIRDGNPRSTTQVGFFQDEHAYIRREITPTER
jgi:hypothetical protein